MTPSPLFPAPILAIRKPGWIEFGNSRVCMMETLGGLYNYREQLAQEVGVEAEAEICQRAGFASAERIIAAGLNGKLFGPDEEGFRQAVALFGAGGYGNFIVEDIRFEDSWAKISATDSIEGWMYQEKGTRHGAACDFARGMFCGLMHHLRVASADPAYNVGEEDADPLGCVESSCLAAGEESCSFIVGVTSDLVADGLQPGTAVQSSIRETLLRLNRQLEHILDHSRKDHLTNLYNRQYFEAALRQRIGFAKRRSDVVSLAVIDVDHFKQVNDTQGHAVGDRVLRQLAYILESQARENDVVARLGGDEFVWLMPNTPPEAAAMVARRLSAHLASMKDELGLTLTVSIGVASYPRDASSPADLVESADNALYVAKEEGRNQVVVSGTTAEKPVVQTASSRPAQATRAASPRTSVAPTPPLLPQHDGRTRTAASRTPRYTLPAIKAAGHEPLAEQTIAGGLRVKSRLRSTRTGRGR